MEAVLVTSKKTLETITLIVGEHRIATQSYLRYLGVQIDLHLNFKALVQSASTKAAAVGKALSRLMPNVGGPKQKRRVPLMSVATSAITYGIAIRADALTTQSERKKVTSVYRLSALRVANGFCTVSKEAVEFEDNLIGSVPFESQKTEAITFPPIDIAFFGGGKSTCVHCIESCFVSGVY
ncbi:uncharacterized protein [Hetaerina americana]|uniref:uncharacterized protein n=1 Tax=Hetaerina americana TaxID=62018 RepID=UPI003A7F45A5